MKRERLLCWVLLMAFAAGVTAAETKSKTYHERLHYFRVEPPVESNPPDGQVEVVEVFLYACPHCYELQPKLEHWLKQRSDIHFRQLPAIIGPTWADQARAFYMAQTLDPTGALHRALFDAIHKKGARLYNRYGVIDFFTGHGIEMQRVVELYESETIRRKTDDARAKTVRYGLRGVPAVVVNGSYVTAPYFVRNQEEMLKVLDYLVDKSRREASGLDRAATAEATRSTTGGS